MTAEKKAHSIASMAEAYELSPDSITKAIKNGDLAPRYFGTKPLIAVEEADRWFATLPRREAVESFGMSFFSRRRKTVDGSMHTAYIRPYDMESAYAWARGLTSAHNNPLTAIEARRYAVILRNLLTSLDREIVDSALIGDRKADLLDTECDEVHRVREFLDRRVLVPFESFELRSSGLALLDAFEHEFVSAAERHVVPSVGVPAAATAGDVEASVGAAPGSGTSAAPGATSGGAA